MGNECIISHHDHFKFEEETSHIKFIPHSDDQHVVALEPSSAQVQMIHVYYYQCHAGPVWDKPELKTLNSEQEQTVARLACELTDLARK